MTAKRVLAVRSSRNHSNIYVILTHITNLRGLPIMFIGNTSTEEGRGKIEGRRPFSTDIENFGFSRFDIRLDDAACRTHFAEFFIWKSKDLNMRRGSYINP